ncbi:hypothetical protein FRC06_002481 [Ceratobasidium sp. 370]|nr:hypothetical protein FRC06_002481 [Ceratobasidium sp. 370]
MGLVRLSGSTIWWEALGKGYNHAEVEEDPEEDEEEEQEDEDEEEEWEDEDEEGGGEEQEQEEEEGEEEKGEEEEEEEEEEEGEGGGAEGESEQKDCRGDGNRGKVQAQGEQEQGGGRVEVGGTLGWTNSANNLERQTHLTAAMRAPVRDVPAPALNTRAAAKVPAGTLSAGTATSQHKPALKKTLHRGEPEPEAAALIMSDEEGTANGDPETGGADKLESEDDNSPYGLQSNVMRTYNPGQVVSCEVFSTKVPSNLYALGAIAEAGGLAQLELLADLRTHCNLSHEAFLGVAEERHRLRQAMVDLGTALAATNSIYVVELTLSGLSHNILHLKDIYVARVARFLQQVYGMARPAMVEVLHMAHDNRLYDNKLMTIQEDRHLTACLWYTLLLDTRTTGVVAKDRNYSSVMVKHEWAGLVPDRDLEYKQFLQGMTCREALLDKPLRMVMITEQELPFTQDLLSMFLTRQLCSNRVEQQSQTEQSAYEAAQKMIMKARLAQRSQLAMMTWRSLADELQGMLVMPMEINEPSLGASETMLPVDLDQGVAVWSQLGGGTWGEAGREGSPKDQDQDQSSDEDGPPFLPLMQLGSKHHPHSTPGAGPSKQKRDTVVGEDSMARQLHQPWESGVVLAS